MRKMIRSPLLAAALVVMVSGTVLATGSTGFHPTTLSRGTVTARHHLRINAHGIELEARGPVDIVTATTTLDAGGSSGWHTRAGVVIITVASGSVTMYDKHCKATVQAAGSAFIESGPNPDVVRNESTTTAAVVYVTSIVPMGTASTALRIDQPNPGCSQS